MAEELKTLQEWAEVFTSEAGIHFNMGTLRKRRAVSGIGRLVPPRTFIMSRAEFVKVMNTPLPFCNKVVH